MTVYGYRKFFSGVFYGQLQSGRHRLHVKKEKRRRTLPHRGMFIIRAKPRLQHIAAAQSHAQAAPDIPIRQ